MSTDWKNKLYFGDNLEIMREYIPDASVDLIYLDPPFNSKATYNVLFSEKSGEQSAAQITAFEDTWHWGLESEETYKAVVTEGPRKLADLLQTLRSFLGQNDMMAYLTMMAIRLVEMHRVLKPTGSLYLHCDPTASHYLKLLMDSVFGPTNFRNEIVWHYRRWTAASGRFQKMHDILLFYAKGLPHIFNPIYIEPTEGQKAKHERGWDRNSVIIDRRRQPQLIIYDKAKVKKAIEEGRIKPSDYARIVEVKLPQTIAPDVWLIDYLNSQAKERLGYPTQKPEALLERIVKASSAEGDLVLDPFCGCGTTITVAERLNRRWIGIDITHLAVSLMKHRLTDTFGDELFPFEVIGDPKDLSGAKALAKQDRYQFEWWALGLIDARPAQDKKKGADTGVDGYIYFFDDNSNKAKKVVVQVKSGHVTVSQIRDLKGVMEREKAEIGVFITLQRPTKPMLNEAAVTGFYKPKHFGRRQYPRLQVLTIEELLNGKRLQYPQMAVRTFKQAERKSKAQQAEQSQLF